MYIIIPSWKLQQIHIYALNEYVREREIPKRHNRRRRAGEAGECCGIRPSALGSLRNARGRH